MKKAFKGAVQPVSQGKRNRTSKAKDYKKKQKNKSKAEMNEISYTSLKVIK